MQEFITIGIYCILGTALMMFGTFVVDLVIPCVFQRRSKREMWQWEVLWRGSLQGSGSSYGRLLPPLPVRRCRSLSGSGILSTLYYYGLGLLFCVVGYVALTLFNRRYDLNKEIGNGNPAAGIMVAGMFVGLSIIISGVIL